MEKVTNEAIQKEAEKIEYELLLSRLTNKYRELQRNINEANKRVNRANKELTEFNKNPEEYLEKDITISMNPMSIVSNSSVTSSGHTHSF